MFTNYDDINDGISNKKFVTYNNYDHTHFFVTSHNLKKTIKTFFEKQFVQNDNKFVTKIVKNKVLIDIYLTTITLFSRLYKPNCGYSVFMQVFLY